MLPICKFLLYISVYSTESISSIDTFSSCILTKYTPVAPLILFSKYPYKFCLWWVCYTIQTIWWGHFFHNVHPSTKSDHLSICVSVCDTFPPIISLNTHRLFISAFLMILEMCNYIRKSLWANYQTDNVQRVLGVNSLRDFVHNNIRANSFRAIVLYKTS